MNRALLSSSRAENQFTKNNFAQGVACEPEALIVAALGGLVYFMSICMEIPVKIGVEAFFNQQ